MLRATADLVARFRGTSRPGPADVTAHIRVITRRGSAPDARALVDLFLEEPTDFWRRELLDVVDAHGDRTCAEALLSCFENGVLRDEVSERVLATIGRLGLPAAETLLPAELFRADYDHYRVLHAAMGLLHFPCAAIRPALVRAIREVRGKNLFPEFLPALACKTEGAIAPEELFAFGTAASTDCNGGLILGIALLGDQGADTFRRVLDDPAWEAFGGGTGSDYWAYVGMCAQGVSFATLADGIRADVAGGTEEAIVRHKVRVVAALLQSRLADRPLPLAFVRPPVETFSDVYRALFRWGNDPNQDASIHSLAQRLGVEFDGAPALLAARMEQEVDRQQ
ncbi:MAG: hypothetical protein AAGE52_26715 [Myxococcota bacterium]